MNIAVILGAMAMVGALGALWWGLTAEPSRARANLFAGLPQHEAPPSKLDDILRQAGTITRRILPNQMVDGLEVRLVQAGHPYGLDLPRMLGIKITLAVFSGLLLFIIGHPLMALVAAVALFFLPDYYVATIKDKRHTTIRLSAADILDQLTICVEAGLGFDAALTRVSVRNEGPLAEELRRTLADIQAGMPRSQALRTLSDRVQVQEIRQLVTALLQAQKHGTSLAETLRVQSAEIRIKRKQLVQERAAKVAVKILFPVILCFMPVFFIVAVVPSITKLAGAI